MCRHSSTTTEIDIDKMDAVEVGVALMECGAIGEHVVRVVAEKCVENDLFSIPVK